MLKMAWLLLCMIPCAAVRPCQLCCENNDSCVYSSKSSKYENVSHSCCGSNAFGRYYCCPERAKNVSYACRGVTGKCKVVADDCGTESLIITCGFILLCMCIANPEARKAPKLEARQVMDINDDFDNDDIDADSS